MVKLVTWNEDVIRRYVESYDELVEKVETGKIELTENDGSLEGKTTYGRKCYLTATGKGKWIVEKSNLMFEGRRTSFLEGSSLMGWKPRRTDGWAVLESTHGERGAFETKKQYYERKVKLWRMNGNTDMGELVIKSVDKRVAEKILQTFPDIGNIIYLKKFDSNTWMVFDTRDMEEDHFEYMHDFVLNSIEDVTHILQGVSK